MGSMFVNREKVMEQVKNLPAGSRSPSRHYWCMTCKMLFQIDEPVCPYMTKVCINAPIPVERLQPESTTCIEKFGLFYPKIPQTLMARLAEGDPAEIAGRWVDEYFAFLDEWSFDTKSEPFHLIRSFIIFITGSVTGQRINDSGVSFVVTDPDKIWDRKRLIDILDNALKLLKERLGISQNLEMIEMDISGDAPYGKYFCAMCRKFFEFSDQRDTITCPIMPQKCMATPMDINKIRYTLRDLAIVYEYTPDFYKRFISALNPGSDAENILRDVLEREWKFEMDEDAFRDISRTLGI